ncbi:MAG: diguanylate cyclase [Proteobacteria bacterium]|nr:diguanylate cyclase [Pseudomonadota bacterium]MBU1061066.1 diguanylate cyclase [Pseudomonadota bacterium]
MEKFETNYGLLSIRNRILIFSVLVTLIPSFGMGWLLNSMIHTTITEKIEQKLLYSGNIIEREISLWFKQRNYDLHILSNSFIISENLAGYLNTDNKKKQEASSPPIYTKKIATYLDSVQKQFDDYSRLFVLDNEGQIVAASEPMDMEQAIQLPTDRTEQIAATNSFKGDVYFTGKDSSPLILIGIPLFSEKRDNLGFLAAEVRLEGILPLLQAALFNNGKEAPLCAALVHLKDGSHFLSTGHSTDPVTPQNISTTIRQLFDSPPHLQSFSDYHGTHVVGLAMALNTSGWGLLITEKYVDVFAKVTRSRNRNILIICSFALLMGVVAYLFAKQIITPLTALTNGSLLVANGNLNVCLPIHKNDELGLATRMFNEMVAELKQNHAKLEQLATTDSLTQLANRKEIMRKLCQHFEHYQRYATEFSILMIDIDHFKKINDTYGHLAGDAVLRQLAMIFQETLRNVDMAGRYGGEEFLVILAETSGEKAQHTGERIRQAVERHTFIYDNNPLKITISIGIARILEEEKNENSLVSRADQALYRAKGNGRNQVVYIASPVTPLAS